jgi:initiation factor 1A
VSLQGGKNRRRGKNENEDDKRELVFREDGQEYAQVVKMLGNGRLEALCFDGEKRLAHIRGKMRKKVCIVVTPVFVISDSSIFLLGMDQSRRHYPALVARVPGRQGGCHSEIHGG